jgi:hypothetical protein
MRRTGLVVVMNALEMLDAVGDRQTLRTGGLDGIQGHPHGGITDGVNRGGETRFPGPTDVAPKLLWTQSSHAPTR